MPWLVFLLGDFFLGNVGGREITEGTVWVFRGVVIFPWFVVFVVGSAEETFKLVLALGY
jgi:hypothetical protein